MAAPVLGRSPTCLSCLRRLTVSPAPSSALTGPSAVVSRMQQVRYKSKKTYDQGVVVRLLEDVPKYGRKDAIFRVERGRMRNLWYPKQKAEYMTAERFAELGLSRREDVGERDPMFRAFENGAEDVGLDEVVEDQGDMPVFSLAPERVHALLSTLVPQTLTFHRKPIHTTTAPAPAPEPETFALPTNRRSPLLAHHHEDEAPKPAPKAAEPQHDAKAIFGSVSTGDILSAVKVYLTNDPEAVRIPLETRAIRFVGEDAGADRVKSLGEWEVEIAVPGASELVPEVQYVRRKVEVVPVKEAE